MQRKEPSAYLRDILKASASIRQYVSGVTFEEYVVDSLRCAAVERQFITVGEAMVQLGRGDPNTLALIPDHRRIIGFRNVLVHGYGDVDMYLVWDAIQIRLPILDEVVGRLLADD